MSISSSLSLWVLNQGSHTYFSISSGILLYHPSNQGINKYLSISSPLLNISDYNKFVKLLNYFIFYYQPRNNCTLSNDTLIYLTISSDIESYQPLNHYALANDINAWKIFDQWWAAKNW